MHIIRVSGRAELNIGLFPTEGKVVGIDFFPGNDRTGKAGFTENQIVSSHTLTEEELKAMACCPGEEFTPPPSEEDHLLVEDKVASVKFTAIRPSPN
jgi:hypothetical protein